MPASYMLSKMLATVISGSETVGNFNFFLSGDVYFLTFLQ